MSDALDMAKSMCNFTFTDISKVDSCWNNAENMAKNQFDIIAQELGVLGYSSTVGLAWLILWGMTYTAFELIQGSIINGRQRYDNQADGTDLDGIMKLRADYLNNATASIRVLKPNSSTKPIGGSGFSNMSGI